MHRLQNLQMPQRDVVELEKLAVLVERQRRQMLHVPAEVVGEVMQRPARRAAGGIASLESEAIQRSDLEMILERKDGGLGRERPVVVARDDLEAAAQQLHQLARFAWANDLGWTQAFKLGQQFSLAARLSGLEITGGQINERQTVVAATLINGAEEVVPLGREHPFVEVRARREDLGDRPFHELARLGLFRLITDRDLLARLQQARDVGVRRVERNAAHRHVLAFGERDVEQARALRRVVEEQLVEVTETEEQQGVLGQLRLDLAVLRHHGRQFGFFTRGHRARELATDSGVWEAGRTLDKQVTHRVGARPVAGAAGPIRALSLTVWPQRGRM